MQLVHLDRDASAFDAAFFTSEQDNAAGFAAAPVEAALSSYGTAGTAGTFGTAFGCIGSVGSYGTFGSSGI